MEFEIAWSTISSSFSVRNPNDFAIWIDNTDDITRCLCFANWKKRSLAPEANFSIDRVGIADNIFHVCSCSTLVSSSTTHHRLATLVPCEKPTSRRKWYVWTFCEAYIHDSRKSLQSQLQVGYCLFQNRITYSAMSTGRSKVLVWFTLSINTPIELFEGAFQAHLPDHWM
jgi:hypothetical protein